MKYLEVPSLSHLSACLTGCDAGDSIIYGRLEAYTCKRAGSDKKLYKELNQQYEELSKSPDSQEALSTSPFGPLSLSTSRRTFISLISTLNASFPDYDFSELKPEHFRKEQSLHNCINDINTTLTSVLPESQSFLSRLWNTLEAEIKVTECDLYSFIPDADSDPFAEEGNIWCFNYFFFNKKLRRVVFFTCRAVSKVNSLSGRDAGAEYGWSVDDQIAEEMDM
jgi:hypothetical protein